ncbi:MAG: MBL fold metallo-hydrolase [Lentisphaeria bacterium]|nr:MBL fold metallo-hydrolase [Lentisphaeria bacterium]
MNEEKKMYTQVVVGELGVNCYLVPGPVSGNLYIIDPGDDADVILHAAEKYTFKEAAILLTHAHVDHIGACGELSRALNIKQVYIHPDDQAFYASPLNCFLPWLPAAENLPPAADFPQQQDFEVIHTPGHTNGGVCFLFKEYNTIFTGDTLFRGSYGRTDLGGNMDQLMNSLKNILFKLSDDLKVCPGHDASSSIGYEKQFNPCLS